MRLEGADTKAIQVALRALNGTFDPPYATDELKDLLRLAPDSAKWDLSHESRLAQEVEKQRVREKARRILARERAGRPFELPDIGLTMADFLREERPEQKYTIDQLHTTGGNTLLVASYKTGKTILLLNLARALADGTPFLGDYDVAKIDGRVAISNYELNRAMIHEWVEDHGVEHPERLVYPLNMRGRGGRCRCGTTT